MAGALKFEDLPDDYEPPKMAGDLAPAKAADTTAPPLGEAKTPGTETGRYGAVAKLEDLPDDYTGPKLEDLPADYKGPESPMGFWEKMSRVGETFGEKDQNALVANWRKANPVENYADRYNLEDAQDLGNDETGREKISKLSTLGLAGRLMAAGLSPSEFFSGTSTKKPGELKENALGLKVLFDGNPEARAQAEEALFTRLNGIARTKAEYEAEQQRRGRTAGGFAADALIGAEDNIAYTLQFLAGGAEVKGAQGLVRAGKLIKQAAPTIIPDAIARYKELTSDQVKLDENGDLVVSKEGAGALEAGAKAIGGAILGYVIEKGGIPLAGKAIGRGINKATGGYAGKALEALGEQAGKLVPSQIRAAVKKLGEWTAKTKSATPRLNKAIETFNHAVGFHDMGEEILVEEGGDQLTDAIFNLSNQYDKAGLQNVPDAARQFKDNFVDMAASMYLFRGGQYAVSVSMNALDRRQEENSIRAKMAGMPEAAQGFIQQSPEFALNMTLLKSGAYPMSPESFLAANMNQHKAVRNGLRGFGLSHGEIAKMTPEQRIDRLSELFNGAMDVDSAKAFQAATLAAAAQYGKNADAEQHAPTDMLTGEKLETPAGLQTPPPIPQTGSTDLHGPTRTDTDNAGNGPDGQIAAPSPVQVPAQAAGEPNAAEPTAEPAPPPNNGPDGQEAQTDFSELDAAELRAELDARGIAYDAKKQNRTKYLRGLLSAAPAPTPNTEGGDIREGQMQEGRQEKGAALVTPGPKGAIPQPSAPVAEQSASSAAGQAVPQEGAEDKGGVYDIPLDSPQAKEQQAGQATEAAPEEPEQATPVAAAPVTAKVNTLASKAFQAAVKRQREAAPGSPERAQADIAVESRRKTLVARGLDDAAIRALEQEAAPEVHDSGTQKQPWEQSLHEYSSQHPAMVKFREKHKAEGGMPVDKKGTREYARVQAKATEDHRDAVIAAIDRGEAVPEAVAKEYPAAMQKWRERKAQARTGTDEHGPTRTNQTDTDESGAETPVLQDGKKAEKPSDSRDLKPDLDEKKPVLQDGDIADNSDPAKLQFEAVTPRGDVRVKGRWRIVAAGDLITSDRPEFDQELQPRDRSTAEATEQVAKMAGNLDPNRLMEGPTTDVGAPFVDSRGHVISGNGRSMAIRQAYEGAKGDEYRAAVIKKAADLGLNADWTSRPVLVREITDTGKATMAQVAELSNRAQALVRSEAETAEADAKVLLRSNIMQLFNPDQSGDVRAASNHEFLKAFIDKAGVEGMRTSDGGFAPALGARVRRAVLAAVFAKADAARKSIADAIENAENLGVKRVLDGVMMSAGRLLKLADAKPQFDLTPYLGAALVEYLAYRKQFIAGEVKTVDQYLAQGDMFAEERLAPVVTLLHEFDSRPSIKAVRALLDSFLGKAENVDTATASLFGEEVPPTTVEELLELARREEGKADGGDQTDLFGVAQGKREEGSEPPATVAGESGAGDVGGDVGGKDARHGDRALQDGTAEASPSPESDVSGTIGEKEESPNENGGKSVRQSGVGRGTGRAGRKTSEVSGKPVDSGDAADVSGEQGEPGEREPVQTDGSGPESGPERGSERDNRGADNESGAGEPAGNGRGDESESEAAPAEVQQPDRPRSPRPDHNRNNHVIREGDTIAPSGQVSKVRANIRAIQTLKKIEKEGRIATPEEQKILAQYTGWGHSGELFNEAKARQYEYSKESRYSYIKKDEAWIKKWAQHYDTLKGLVTDEEWEQLSRSILFAHYTSADVVRGAWEIAKHLGFKGGNVLEPAAGIGNFFGLMPDDVSRRSNLVGVEIEPFAGRMLKALYPDAQVFIDGFEGVKIPDNSIDLAITNVPFNRSQSIPDKRYPDLNLHNYFLARMIDAVKPGGLVVALSSYFTMDANKDQRQFLSDRADLIGAIRLPNTAFKQNAGTEVVTDILIFRKPDEGPRMGQPWVSLGRVPDIKQNIPVNEYYQAHPDMMLGIPSLAGTMYGGKEEFTLNPNTTSPLPEQISGAMAKLPANVFGRQKAVEVDFAALGEAKGHSDGTILVRDGVAAIVLNGNLVAPEKVVPILKGAQAQERMKAYAALRDAYLAHNALSRDEATTDAAFTKSLASLNKLYDAFVKKHGPITQRRSPNAFLEIDPRFYFVSALERQRIELNPKTKLKEVVYEKAAALAGRTVWPVQAPTTAKDLYDAVLISMGHKGQIDPVFIGELLGRDAAAVTTDLIEGGHALRNPETGLLEQVTRYTSGNVRDKLEKARKSAETNPDYQRNVEALEKALPERITIKQMDFRLGATWMPSKVVSAFVQNLFDGRGTIEYSSISNRWVEDGWFPNKPEWNVIADGWHWYRGIDLVMHALNLKSPRAVRTETSHGVKTTYTSPKATLLAQDKISQLQLKFRQWVMATPEATRLVEDAYNEATNNTNLVELNGDHLTLPGKAENVTLRPNVKRGIWRMIQDQAGILAHAVGAGKTYTMIGTVMESRRLGLAKKPMMVVQNQGVGQVATSFLTMYPSANILVPTKKDFSADRRRRLFARIAAEDFDAVILPQSQFDRIANDPEREVATIEESLRELRDALAQEEMKNAGSKKKTKTQKQIENRIRTVEARLTKARERATKGADKGMLFEELGVDLLVIDEIHAYKKPPTESKLQNLVGLNLQGSARAWNLLMKATHVQEKRGNGRGVIGATGTPITNTLGETWQMIRLTNPRILGDFGVEHFDDFIATFAEIGQIQTMNGAGRWVYKNGIKQFVNGYQLTKMIRSAWDVITSDELAGILKKEGDDLPVMKGGNIEAVKVPLSENMERFTRFIRNMYDVFAKLDGNARREKSYIPMMGFMAARAAAIDTRLVYPDLPDEPGSKVNVMIDSVMEIYDETKAEKGAQLIFSDIVNPFNIDKLTAFMAKPDAEQDLEEDDSEDDSEKDNKEEKSFLYQDIKRKLVARGIPANEIAFANQPKTDEQKEALWEKVNTGEVRILLGSSAKMGVGLNIQQKLIALHQLDAPFLPADIEQRIGRIIRSGNQFPEVYVRSYGMENTPDAASYALLLRKAKFIRQAMSKEGLGATFTDPGSADIMSYQEQMAAFSGDPRLMRKIEVDQRVRELAMLEEQHHDDVRRQAAEANRLIQSADHTETVVIPYMEKLIAALKPKNWNWKEYAIQLWDKKFTGEEAAKAITEKLEATRALAPDITRHLYFESDIENDYFAWFQVNGVRVRILAGDVVTPSLFAGGKEKREFIIKTRYDYQDQTWYSSAETGAGILRAIENGLSSMEERLPGLKRSVTADRKEAAEFDALAMKPFEYAEEFAAMKAEQEEIDKALAEGDTPKAAAPEPAPATRGAYRAQVPGEERQGPRESGPGRNLDETRSHRRQGAMEAFSATKGAMPTNYRGEAMQASALTQADIEAALTGATVARSGDDWTIAFPNGRKLLLRTVRRIPLTPARIAQIREDYPELTGDLSDAQIDAMFVPFELVDDKGRSVDAADLILFSKDEDTPETLLHEVVHAAKAWGLFRNSEWEALVARARSATPAQIATRLARKQQKTGMTRDQLVAFYRGLGDEEAVAHYMQGKNGFWRRLALAFKRMFARLTRNTMLLRGIETEQAFRSGNLFARQQAAVEAMETAYGFVRQDEAKQQELDAEIAKPEPKPEHYAQAEEILAEAERQKPEFLDGLESVARLLGAAVSDTTPTHAVKGKQRIAEKLAEKGRVSDALRGTIVLQGGPHPTRKQVLHVLQKMRASGYMPVPGKIDNLYENPHLGEYRHLQINFQKPGSDLVTEVLLIQPAMLRAKHEVGHLLYEIDRSNRDLLKRHFPAEMVEELVREAVYAMNNAYAVAYQEDLGASPSASSSLATRPSLAQNSSALESSGMPDWLDISSILSNVSPLVNRFMPLLTSTRNSGSIGAFSDTLNRLSEKGKTSNTSIPQKEKYSLAWTASPAVYDQASTDYIGTGEGTQSRGWGLYFAQEKAVADWYRRQLDLRGGLPSFTKPDGSTISGPAVLAEYFKPGRILPASFGYDKVLSFTPPDAEGRWAVEVVEVRGPEGTPIPGERARRHATLPEPETVIRVLGKDGWTRAWNTRLYKVNLTPRDEQYLDLDKTFHEQSDYVRRALVENYLVDAELDASATGDEIYQNIRELMQGYGAGSEAAQRASQTLLEAGIPGAKFLDEDSRFAGEGTHNYVIYDAAAVDIVERYSVTIPPAAQARMEEARDAVQEWLGKSKYIPGWVAELRKKKDASAKPDLHPADRMLRTILYYAEKVPALQKMFDIAMRRQDDAYAFFDLNVGKGDQDETLRIQKLRKEWRAGYEALNEHLFAKDRNAVGYLVKEEGQDQYVALDLPAPNGERKPLGRFTTEEAAWMYLYDLEASEYADDLMQNQSVANKEAALAARALRGIRVVNHRVYAMLRESLDQLRKEYEAIGREMPAEIVVHNDDGTQEKINLWEAMRRMGDRRGYYMPRSRKNGRYALFVTKPGENPQRLHFDTAAGRAAHYVKLRAEGYEAKHIRKDINAQPSEEAFLEGNLVAMNDMVQNALASMRKASRAETTYQDLGIEADVHSYTRKDGTKEKHLIIQAPKDHEFAEAFKEFGGQFYADSQTGTGPAWHFVNPSKKLKDRILRRLTFTQIATRSLDLFNEALMTNLAELIHGRGSRAHKIGRVEATGVDVWRGYEEDAERAVIKLARGVAGGSAKRLMAKDMVKAFTGMDVSWQEYKAERLPEDFDSLDKEDQRDELEQLWADYEAMVNEKRIDSGKQPEAFAEGMSFMKELLRNEEPIERVLGALKGLTAVKYLSRVSSALVNLTAIPTVVVPAMHTFANIDFKRSPALLTRAARKYTQHWLERKGLDVPDTVRATITPEEAALFDEIRERRWDDAQYRKETLAALQSLVGRNWNRAADLAMVTFTLTEKLNRGATIAATYWGIKENHRGPWTPEDHEAALKQAHETALKAHGLYSKENAPAWTRGGSLAAVSARSAYMFSTFTHNYLQLIHATFKEKDQKAVAWLLVSPMILAGPSAGPAAVLAKVTLKAIAMVLEAVGIPMPDDPLEALYQWIEKTFGWWPSRFARQGLIGGVTGIDIRGSLGVTFGLPTDIWDFLGAPAATLSDYLEAARAAGRGDLVTAAEKAAPAVLAAPIRAYREYTRGVTTQTGYRKFLGGEAIQPNLYQTFLRSLGFTPAGVSEKLEKGYSDAKVAAKYAAEKSEIYARARLYALRGENNPAAWLDIVTDANAFNERVKRQKLRKGLVSMIPKDGLLNQAENQTEAPSKEKYRDAQKERAAVKVLTKAPGY